MNLFKLTSVVSVLIWTMMGLAMASETEADAAKFDKLCQTYQNDQNWTEAARWCVRAAEAAPTYERLSEAALVLNKSDLLEDAQGMAAKADGAAMHEFGPESVQRAVALNILGVTLANLGEHSISVQRLREAVRIIGLHHDEAHPDHATIKRNLEGVQEVSALLDQLEDEFDARVRSYVNNKGQSSKQFIGAISSVVSELADTERRSKAIKMIRRARDAAENTVGDTHNDFAMATYYLAAVLSKDGSSKEAVVLLSQAARVFEQSLGADSEITKKVASEARMLRILSSE